MPRTYELEPWAVAALERIADLTDQIRGDQLARDRLVLDLRAGACPWTEIAAAVGLSPQGAQQRYSKLMGF